MQITLLPPKEIGGTIYLPASKSLSNRALIITALSQKGRFFDEKILSCLQNISDCDDTRVMLTALQERPETVNVQAAGTAMRFLTAYLSVIPGTHLITGSERMRHRPIAPLVNALRRLGSRIDYFGDEGFPPLHIKGSDLSGGELDLPGGVSSQYISALLMIGPVLANGMTLHLTGQVVSRPYIDMTLEVMHHFGAQAQWMDERTIHVESGGYKLTPYYIESDWSASSYWYETIALSSDPSAKIILPGLFQRSLQGDRAVQRMFRPLGVETEFVRDASGLEGILLRKTECQVKRLSLDFSNQPDLAQTLVVTCAMLGIPFHFTGLQSLKIKETDRLAALRIELRKLGYILHEEQGSILQWDGERTSAQPDAAIDTYEDHRMAMSFAPACLKLGSIKINDPHVVSKSYPSFWDDLKKAQFKVQDTQYI